VNDSVSGTATFPYGAQANKQPFGLDHFGIVIEGAKPGIAEIGSTCMSPFGPPRADAAAKPP
jgi:hypothetical protein